MADDDTPTAPDGVVIGVDIGGTKTALLATDVRTGDDLAEDTFATPAAIGPAAMVDRIEAAVDDLLHRDGRGRPNLAAIGIAAPGLVNASSGRVILAGNLEGWVDVPLRDLVGRRLGVPVAIDRDASAAALGERWRGAAQRMDNFVFLALGTGIGAAVVVNGRLHRGAHQAAGEVGNLLMGRQFLGQQGGLGTLAQLVGGKTLHRRAWRATGEPLSAAAAIGRATEDAQLMAMTEEVADYVAMAVVAIAALLDPEAIVFGGGTAQAGEDLLEPVRERVERELPVAPALVRSALGAEAQLRGAVFSALQELDLALT